MHRFNKSDVAILFAFLLRRDYHILHDCTPELLSVLFSFHPHVQIKVHFSGYSIKVVCPPPNRTAPTTTKTSIPVSPVTSNQRFPRGTASRSTFHGGPIRERRHASTTYNGPGAVPSHTQDTSAMGQQGRMSFFNKLTSKFSRRCVAATFSREYRPPLPSTPCSFLLASLWPNSSSLIFYML